MGFGVLLTLQSLKCVLKLPKLHPLRQQESVMAHPVSERNPFMLMINPEVVLAAMAKSERLEQLNRHLCRPLDRPVNPGGDASAAESDDLRDTLRPSDPL